MIQESIRQFHRGNCILTDTQIDKLLGIRSDSEQLLELTSLISEHGLQRFDNAETPYRTIRQMVPHFAAHGEKCRIFDLGSGYGRIGLYSALLTNIDYIGFELIKCRADSAKHAAATLGITHSVRFVECDALEYPWPKVDVFVWTNSMLPSQIPKVLQRLDELISLVPYLKIISFSTAADHLGAAKNITELTSETKFGQPRVFLAKHAAGRCRADL